MKWWVVVAFVASVVTALGFFLVVPSLVALVVAIVVRSAMKARGSGGIGLANAAVRVSAWSAAVGVVFVLMGSSLCACGGGKSRELANRSVCAANLRGITQAMNSYAEENGGRYPLVAFAPYARVRNEPRGVPVAANVQQAMRTIESEQTPQAGSVPACLWLLVLNDQLVPKQFVCKSDPAGVQSAELKDSRGVYCDNFQDGTRLSYSMAYPWNSAGETGAWWKAAADASLPLIADMTPKQGSGSPAHNLVPSRAPSQRGIWNSVNHQGDGENVGFGDGHAEFV
ncbi:MAG TPA: hypothetical protein VHM90_03135 [Phycisphaerae bacterium]|nr:hypothetical protein [Phycisphaerae bacterium]